VAFGEGAEALAKQAEVGQMRQLFTADVPIRLIELLERAGLVYRPNTMMGGVVGNELQFYPPAAEFIAPFFH
jgi:hypothetical protein